MLIVYRLQPTGQETAIEISRRSFKRRRAELAAPIARQPSAPNVAEAMERRVLLSGYTLQTLGSFVQAPYGESPTPDVIYSNVSVDSSGDLFGTTRTTGTEAGGTVFKVASGSSTITTLATFNGADGAYPPAGVTLDSSGDIFGTTEYGGAYGDGTVFEIPHGSNTITILASFNGAGTSTGVALDSSGDLFGTTDFGGADESGSVYEITHGSDTITTYFSFNGLTGYGPETGVTLDSSGDLFGTISSNSSVFEIAAASTAFTILASLPNPSNHPIFASASLALDSSGDLFGVGDGFAPQGASVFELAHGSTTLTPLAPLLYGGPLASGVVLDSSGDLFGTLGFSQGGTVFEIPHGSSTMSTVANFNYTNGAIPYSGVTLDSSGDLFGTTDDGGPTGAGTVFEIPHGSSTITTVAAFLGNDGSQPNGLALDSSGNLFGTTLMGGAETYLNIPGDGTVFEIANGSSTITSLASFNGIDGKSPLGDLVQDSSGDFFGTTEFGMGGTYAGSVFEIVKGSSSITTFATFNSANSYFPEPELSIDSSGDLFGTTEEGPNGQGTIFEIASGSTTITSLAAGLDGSQIPYSVTPDSSGNLFGTTYTGGASGDGTVFELARGSSTVITLATFDDTNGANPAAGVTLDSSGDLFGTTTNGGEYGNGTVFEIARGGSNANSTIITLASFNGAGPSAGVTLDSSGDLFGTTPLGGAFGYGSVYEIVHGSSAIITLFSFNGGNGGGLNAGVILDSSGDLFGTTSFALDADPINPYDNGGTVFELIPTPTTVNLGSSSPVTYGTPVTFTATVTTANGDIAPTGCVSFVDLTAGDALLGTANSPATTDSGAGTWVYTTGVKQLNVTTGDTIEAIYSPGPGFAGNSGTTTEVVTARPITVTASTNSKTYDGTSTATATPTITSGTLVAGDTADFTESYGTKNAGTGETLTPAGSVSDGDEGDDYAVTFVTNDTGVISPRAITVTAATNSKTYDGTTSAAAVPTITSGTLVTGDTAHFNETYTTSTGGTSKTLTPAVSVQDGNNGHNYTITFINNTTGRILAAPTIIHASDLGGNYNGKPLPAAGYVAGVGGADIATPVFTYYLASDRSLKHPLPTPPSSPGNYVFIATFAGNANYLPTATSASFSIRIPVTSFKATALKFTAGVAFSGTVAQFSAPAGLSPSEFSATINWGDGETSTTTVVAGAKPGQFLITAKHTYAKNHTYTTTITLGPAGSAALITTGSAS